jgi:hypothetical protein
VELTLAWVDPDVLDLDRITVGAARVASLAPDPERVRLVIAGDFIAAVAERVDDAEYAKHFHRDRTFGSAAAKTIEQADGSVDLIVDAELVAKGQPEDFDSERLFAHEGYHVAIGQREESLNDIRLRHGLGDYSHQGYFTAVAGNMGEEYRVERALCNEGWWPDVGYREGIPDGLTAFRNELLDGVTNRYRNEPVDRCCRTVLQAFYNLAILMGYLAAEHLGSAGERTPDAGVRRWSRLVGPAWGELLDLLEAMPSANERTPRAQLDEQAFALADVLARWLEHIGFTIDDLDEGFYFRVVRHDFD